MNKLKGILGTTGVAAVLTIGLAAPVAADHGYHGKGSINNSNQHNTTLAVNGNGSAIIQTKVNQGQNNISGNFSIQISKTEKGSANNNNSQSNSSNQSQSADVVFTTQY